MHPGRIVLLVAIAVMSAGCSGPVPPALVPMAGASRADTDAPASSPSAAASPSQGGVIQDLEGDAVMTDNAEAPGYLDMTGAGVELRDGAFVFTQLLVEGVPPSPDLPEGVDALGWSVCIDLDPRLFLRGYPMRQAMPCELIVHTRWDGVALTGMVFDRRPLADGKEVATTTIEPSTAGSSVSETVPPQLLPETATFRWSTFTEELGPLGTNIAHHVDAAPDGGTGRPATWPSK